MLRSLLLFFIFLNQVYAADISFAPYTNSVVIGNTVDIAIFLNTEGAEIAGWNLDISLTGASATLESAVINTTEWTAFGPDINLEATHNNFPLSGITSTNVLMATITIQANTLGNILLDIAATSSVRDIANTPITPTSTAINISAVPEPTTILGSLLVLGFIVFQIRKKSFD